MFRSSLVKICPTILTPFPMVALLLLVASGRNDVDDIGLVSFLVSGAYVGAAVGGADGGAIGGDGGRGAGGSSFFQMLTLGWPP
jgi:hypothetical protein